MNETLPRCVNHRDVATRVSCSSCGDPICPRCMRQSAVGQKCPRCAKLPRRARAYGKPIHYVKGVGGGLATAFGAGLLYVRAIGAMGFGTLILAGLLGFGVGRVVRWGAASQSQPPWPAVAATCAVAGMVLAHVVTYQRLPLSGFLLLAYAVAGYAAVRGLHG